MQDRAFCSFSLVFLTICIGCLPIEGAVTPPSNCGALPSITSGHFSDGETSIDAERKLTCDAGYKLTGSDILKCYEGGRWKFSGSCTKEPSKGEGCGAKPKVNCGEGFGIEFYSAKCGDDGFWITELKCAPACGALPEIKGATFSDGTFWIDSVREVTCKKGFTLEGSSTIKCGDDGKWSKAPTCKREDETEDESSPRASDLVMTSEPAGNISCSDSNSTDLFWPHQRCDGKWDCENGADEVKCPNKCRAVRYPTLTGEIIECRASIPRVYYDWETGKCVDFIYGGCGDLANMFESKDECRRECDGVIIPPAASAVSTTEKATGEKTAAKPIANTDTLLNQIFTEERPQANSATFIGDEDDDTKKEEESHETADEGEEFPCDPTGKISDDYKAKDRCDGKYTCENGADEFNCTRKCYGIPYEEDPSIASDCMMELEMWFYDIKTGKCKSFTYGGCAGVVNMFQDERECLRECKGVVLDDKIASKKGDKEKDIKKTTATTGDEKEVDEPKTTKIHEQKTTPHTSKDSASETEILTTTPMGPTTVKTTVNKEKNVN